MNSLFKSDEKEIIDENKIDSTSSYILKHYTNDLKIILLWHLQHFWSWSAIEFNIFKRH